MNLPRLGEAFYNLRFRTRLVLLLFLVLAVTSAILLATYIRENRRIKAYVAGITSDLVAISQLTQEQVPAKATRTQALEAYMQTLKGAGLYSITVASPSGEVVASTNPRQVGRRIKIKRRRTGSRPINPIEISAEFPETDVNSGVGEKTYFVEFPIVQGDKVIGYARVRGFGDQLDALLRRSDLARSVWILGAMLAGIFAMVYLTLLFTKPVDMLAEGAKQVARGNLYVSLPVKGKDEMGRLAQTFNQMVERLRETRMLQERLNEAEKLSLLGRFAASVAHEVRNSLNFINLSIDQIRAKQAILSAAAITPAGERAAFEVQRNLANVKEEINRLNHLVNEFLSAGRQTPPHLELCDLREALKQAVALVEKQARAQDVTIRTELAGDFPEIQADVGQMKTCFVNLLTNSIQAMPRGGHIYASFRQTAGNGGTKMLEFSFADTGPGIPSGDREKVFTPFFSTKATGFGLGLAITKKIVEDHVGRIYIRDGEQPGALIVIELPANSVAAVSRESSQLTPVVSNS